MGERAGGQESTEGKGSCVGVEWDRVVRGVSVFQGCLSKQRGWDAREGNTMICFPPH
jgi:hypothetical protein